jgi:ABC-type multidrug transport system fused ATPase/permease subunit
MYLIKKSWQSLDNKQKNYSIFIFVMMFIAMFLESLSVGIIIPLISTLLNYNTGESIFSKIFISYEYLRENLIYIVMIATIIIFIIKNLILTFNLWHQTKFLRQLQLELTNRLFKHYLKSNYIFFLQNNSGRLYRNLTDITGSFVSYAKSQMTLISEIIILTGIVLILFYVDFLGTSLILISAGILSLVIYTLTIKKISFFGKERNIVGAELNKHLLQGMAAAKDVKILDREEDLIYQVNKNLFKMTRLNHIIQFITGLPRFSFEMLMVFIFSIIIFVMLGTKREVVDIIQYLGVFAVASFRLAPGISRILSSYQVIKYIEPSVKILLNEYNFKNNSENKKISINKKDSLLNFNKEINLKNIYFSYPSRKDFSLSKISIDIKKGDSVGIIGETGSGKSTLANLLIGLLEPNEGDVVVDSLNIKSNLSSWHKKIGYVPQSVYLTDDTIRKNIAFGLREENINDDLIKKAIEKANLKVFLNSLKDGAETVVGEKGIRISGGQQQRIGIARALYRDPEILILDEATSSLDQATEKKIMESVNFLKKTKTLIIITHRLTTVKNCDKIFMFDKGKIVKQGSPNEILNSNN